MLKEGTASGDERGGEDDDAAVLGENAAQEEVVVVQEEDEGGQNETSSQSVGALDVVVEGDESGVDRVSVGKLDKYERFMDTAWEHWPASATHEMTDFVELSAYSVWLEVLRNTHWDYTGDLRKAAGAIANPNFISTEVAMRRVEPYHSSHDKCTCTLREYACYPENAVEEQPSTSDAPDIIVRGILEERGPQEWNLVSENGEMIVEKLCWEFRTKKKRVLKDVLLEGDITKPGVEAVQAAMAVARTAKDDEEARDAHVVFAKRKALQ
ncbi:MAG: hypothetical protein SGPRY_002503 [Prymnesium sp.]